MKKDIIIGIDGGTGSIRAGFYRTDGKCVGFSVTDYQTKRLHNGWAEQSPYEWWNSLKCSIKKGLENYSIDPSRIIGLATATTCCSVVLCMKDGVPVRDSLIWMDVRACQEADEIAEKTGEHLSSEWMPCKLLWLKRYERENYDKADIFCEYQDWITYMLTGKWSVNINTACNWGYNNHNRCFPQDFYNKIGLEEATSKFPDENVYAVGDKIGYLSEWASKELGLDKDTIVAQGGIDSSIGVLGMGVYKKGKVALMTGSSNLAMILTDKMIFSDSTINIGPDHLINSLYTAFRGQVSSGSILAWFKKEFCRDLPEDKVFDILNKEAEKIPVGSEGLLVLDYWMGNRHPYFDTKVRGNIYGYSLSHTRAHIYRAIMEGIAYGTENLLYQFREQGLDINEINISGGTTNSDLFLQIHADVSNVRVLVPEDGQSVGLGCAISVAKSADIYDSLADASKAMVKIKRVIEPNAENHKIYKRLFEQYRKMYPQFKEWMHETTDICLK